MATTVHFTSKDGKASKVTFPTRALAENYAKTVRNSRLEDSDATATEVAVTKCPEGTAEAQKVATNAYFRGVKTPKSGYVLEAEYRATETEFELMSEHFGAARAAGQPMEDAFKDWDFVRGVG